MKDMRAIVITKYGEPEVLREERLPIPEAKLGTVVVRVRAFGLNHAEAFFRKGVWGDVAKVTGIECVGEVHDPGASTLRRGQRVFGLMGGMGRSIDGSYAEYAAIPEGHVIVFESAMEWTDLAAIPESYATAWTFLRHNLEVKSGSVIVVRGGTSALGQAAINLARDMEVRVLATTRSREKTAILEALGAEPLIEKADLSTEVRKKIPAGVDGVLEIVGTSTLLDSFKMVRYRGRVAMAGFLGGLAPLKLCRAACSSASSRAPSCSASPISPCPWFRSATSSRARSVASTGLCPPTSSTSSKSWMRTGSWSPGRRAERSW
jgi:NADPH2:quinone reductase